MRLLRVSSEGNEGEMVLRVVVRVGSSSQCGQ